MFTYCHEILIWCEYFMCCDILLIHEPLINCELLCACALTKDISGLQTVA